MPLGAIGLLFASAILHTTWNLFLKQSGEKYVAIWWAAVIGAGLFIPVLFFTGLPARAIWYLLLLSVLLEAAYYVVLAAGYNDSDFSLIYPMGRGTAPAFIALWSVLFLHETFTVGGVIGLIIIIFGLLVVGSSDLFQSHGKPRIRGILLAFSLALLISIYTVVDGTAVRQTAALPYTIMIFFLLPIFSAPLIIRHYGWPMLKAEFGSHFFRLLAIGVLTVAAYSLALWAYSFALLGYAGAIREVSVVMGAFAGWQFLDEKMGGRRVVGAIVIFAGILVIAIFG
jgi:drug/metabolite transporter (DMT)-like permease